MAGEKIAVALRVLGAINRFRLPDKQDLDNLRSWVNPDMRDWPPDELARYIIDQELARRNASLREGVSDFATRMPSGTVQDFQDLRSQVTAS